MASKRNYDNATRETLTSLEPATVLLVQQTSSALIADLESLLGPNCRILALTTEQVFSQESLLKFSPPVIVIDQEVRKGPAIEVLVELAGRWPDAALIVLAEHEDLPTIIRAGGNSLVRHVLPRQGSMENLAETIGRVLDESRQGSSSQEPHPLESVEPAGLLSSPYVCTPRPQITNPDLHNALVLLEKTAVLLARGRGMVIRPFSPSPPIVALEFVTPDDVVGTLARFGREFKRLWGETVKPYGKRAGLSLSRHPILKWLPSPSKYEQIYAKTSNDTLYAFLAVIPWKSEGKCTVLLGLAPLSPSHEEILNTLQSIHWFAAAESPEFPLPNIPRETIEEGRVWYAKEYDWVVTRNYVGPDRRKKPTSAWSFRTLSGRRRLVPENLLALSGAFVDVTPPWVKRWVALYLLMSFTDTWLTWVFVQGGYVEELNPLLRAALKPGPLVFFGIKNLLSLSAILVVMRFHLWRIGRLALRINALFYTGLVLYWLFVLGFIFFASGLLQ